MMMLGLPLRGWNGLTPKNKQNESFLSLKNGMAKMMKPSKL
jgi:hypothetical protein